ncbi:hypothetical protein O181_095637 [Austropuccinia psidii MF-1]|uniref:Uncharacterized protein n=1 Tax=Austropuccinia psidii MF-1 TaxID=1389203 RepID=A0A9Q3PCQ6_9BASI|nr:hypothetical protein [Austropuccinia psidii MF-1]
MQYTQRIFWNSNTKSMATNRGKLTNTDAHYDGFKPPPSDLEPKEIYPHSPPRKRSHQDVWEERFPPNFAKTHPNILDTNWSSFSCCQEGKTTLKIKPS